MAGRQAKALKHGELLAVLRATRKTRYPARDRVMVLLSAKAGLRAAEIAGLTWAMVLNASGDLADHIALDNSIAKKGSGRLIPIHPVLRTALVAHRRHGGSGGPVVKSERGERMRAGSIVNWFRAFYTSLGFTGCSSHSGRRTFITMAARKVSRAGGSIRDVQALAGHRSLAHTQGYIDGNTKAQRRLVGLL